MVLGSDKHLSSIKQNSRMIHNPIQRVVNRVRRLLTALYGIKQHDLSPRSLARRLIFRMTRTTQLKEIRPVEFRGKFTAGNLSIELPSYHEILDLELHRSISDLAQGSSSERMVEIPLAKRWISQHANFIEVGAVLPYYGITGHNIIDPADPYPGVSNIDAENASFKDQHVLSISTIEHMGLGDYGLPKDPNKCLRVLLKILNEAKTCMITFPLGFNQTLDEFFLRHKKDLSFISFQRLTLGAGKFIAFPHPGFDPQTDTLPQWKQRFDLNTSNARYNEPFPFGNFLVILHKGDISVISSPLKNFQGSRFKG